MISFELFEKLMSFETKGTICIEILFKVKGSDKFDFCWMGKLYDKEKNSDVFWFGITPDGENAYDYLSFDDFSSDNVFDGKSLYEIWNEVSIEEINACDPEDMIEIYLSGSGGLCAP